MHVRIYVHALNRIALRIGKKTLIGGLETISNLSDGIGQKDAYLLTNEEV